MEQKLLDLLNNLCNGFISDGTVYEEVIDMLVDAGADIPILKAIGFDDNQIQDYCYYVSILDDITQEEAFENLKNLG